jgi:hypothetical protein
MYLIKAGFIDDGWLNDEKEIQRKNKKRRTFLIISGVFNSTNLHNNLFLIHTIKNSADPTEDQTNEIVISSGRDLRILVRLTYWYIIY